MRAAVVVDAVRSPVGARGGKLSGWHAADLTAELLGALATRTGLDPARVDDVVLGCAMQVGSQGFNLARSAVLAAGWPERIPGGTLDRQGVSSLAAVLAAAAAVSSGVADVVVAGGVEVMSTTPHGATLVPGAMPFGPGVAERYREAGGLVPAGPAAEALAAAAGLRRDDLDEWALRSHRLAVAGPELVPVAARVLDRDKGEVVRPGTTVAADELPRPTLDAADLGAFEPSFAPGGVVTAGNSAAIGDGVSLVLVTSEEAAAAMGREPLARIAGGALVGSDPLAMLAGATPAVEEVLASAGLATEDIDRYEVGEPFAVVPLTLLRALGIEPERCNPRGGGIALGEPTGAAGARLVATLAHGLQGRWGVAAGAAAGGLGAAVLLERP